MDDITDGTAKTGMMSEWIPTQTIGDNLEYVRGIGYILWISKGTYTDKETFIQQCLSIELSPDVNQTSMGLSWIDGFETAYHHVFTPNRRSCEGGPFGARTPSSFHPGGVHLLFADGHVDFIDDSIDQAIWRSWGTRNGGEKF